MKWKLLVSVAVLALAAVAPASAGREADVRFATFNASLNRSEAGQLAAQLAAPGVDDVYRRQIRNVAEVIQRVRPDVLLINEFDYDNGRRRSLPEQLPRGLAERRRADPLPLRVRRAVQHRHPLRERPRQQRLGRRPERRLRFRLLPGAVRSRRLLALPDRLDAIRTFQTFLWKDMPGAGT